MCNKKNILVLAAFFGAVSANPAMAETSLEQFIQNSMINLGHGVQHGMDFAVLLLLVLLGLMMGLLIYVRKILVYLRANNNMLCGACKKFDMKEIPVSPEPTSSFRIIPTSKSIRREKA